ncbi:MAG: MBOAT family O-acyltransferase [Patescibacteria group bacterium]
MLFNSFSFFIFFPVVVFLYYIVPAKWRTLLLLMASSYFYMAFVPKYILILFALITADFFLGKYIEGAVGVRRRMLLIFSVIANLGTLFVFKYFNFFNENIAALAGWLHWNYSPLLLTIILPLGLSFHIFQSLSYVIEVYRGRHPAERSYLAYALYVMFFPQLVAGPIERPQHLLPQLHLTHKLDFGNIRRGLERILWGLMKKIVIADNLAAYVDQVYNYPHNYSGPVLLVATIFFAFQVYCDFSGYSDIAVGSARVLGVELSENFNRPFLSLSMAEFWRRWHISLSNWLRDYLYYPLALKARGNARFRLSWALFVTMVLIGLWHGANWTFVVFGALHGTYLVVGQFTKNARERLAGWVGLTKIPRLLRTLQAATTFFLASIGFLVFRANSLSEAIYIFTNALSGTFRLVGETVSAFGQFSLSPFVNLISSLTLEGAGRRQFVFFWALIILFFLLDKKAASENEMDIFRGRKAWLRWSLYIIAALCIMNLGVTHEIPFIYFQF